MLKRVVKKVMVKGDRGATAKFMWLNRIDEPEFSKLFPIESAPGMAVMKTGKRNRYFLHEGAPTEDAFTATLQKVLGGDGKFTMIKGALPLFSMRKIEAS
jgi:hypothetical protein